MDLQNLMPQQSQPISRITSGQMPTELAELSEEVLATADSSFSSDVLPSYGGPTATRCACRCSYDGDDAE
jgi:bacteriocin leader peptide (microcyclamide/patellamide family)